MMINNKISSSFKLEILRPQSGNQNMVDLIKKLSKLKYGKPKIEVEAEIGKRSQPVIIQPF